jgi:p-hydroxybenzoate 3-monooxygenase
MLQQAGVADNLNKLGLEHDGVELIYKGRNCRIDFFELTGSKMTIYGQTEVTRDLYQAREKTGGRVFHKVTDVTLAGIDTESPKIQFHHEGQAKTLNCDFVIGCDGYHGVSRAAIPSKVKREYQSSFPFAWLGVLADAPPVSEELIYAYHQRGFALCSMRSKTRSRYYIQVPLDAQVDQWPDDRFWSELIKRLPSETARNLITGPSIEKSIAPLRSFVCEPMRWKSLFLAGDAAHIVPPTGAKGLNLAVSDVHYLLQALSKFYQSKDTEALDNYSQRALDRVWKSSRFSWSMTQLMHDFYEDVSPFSNRIREAEFEYLISSQAARISFAENYVGLPY